MNEVRFTLIVIQSRDDGVIDDHDHDGKSEEK